MTPTQRPTFTQRVIGGDGGGFSYLLASGGASPSLNFDFTTGVLPGAITFTRASIGTYVNNAGTLITATSNVARFNYVGGVSCLLIEPAATNLIVQSNNFATSWNPVGSPVRTAAQFISPDGANNGWTVSGDTAFGYAGLAQSPALSTSTPYIFSSWIKQITGGNVTFDINGATGPTMVPTAILSRLSVAVTSSASVNYFEFLTSGNSGQVNGFYGAQLELGSKVTSYIPTTTAAVTRAADSATFTIPSGVGHLTYTFDDNTTQSVTVSAGSYTIPTTLNRPNIKSIVGSA